MARCPFATWRSSPNFNAGGITGQPYGVVFHVEQGTEQGTEAVFSEPSWQASSHFGVAKDGSLDQFVDTADKAWAEAEGNGYWWSIEHEGMSGQPLTDAQIATDVHLIAWLRTIDPFPLVLTDDPNGRGLIWHGAGGDAWGGHYDCPGEAIKANRQDVIDKINSYSKPSQPRRPLMFIANSPVGPGIWLVAGGTKSLIANTDDVGKLLNSGIPGVITVSEATLDAIPTAKV